MRATARHIVRIGGRQTAEVLRWSVLAVVIGVVVALTIFAFLAMVRTLWEWVAGSGWGVYVAPVAGAGLVGVTAYRLTPASRGAGLPDYIYLVNTRQGYVPRLMVVTKFYATIVTVGSGVSGGVVGPGALIGAGVGAHVGRRLRWIFPRTVHGRRDVRLAATCGCAAAVAAILNAPIGAALFAVEILFPASIHYQYFFPAALASAVASVMYRALAGHEMLVRAPQLALGWSVLAPVLLTTLLVTLVGLAFTRLYQRTHRLAYSRRRWPWLAPMVGAALCVGVAALGRLICGQRDGAILGTGEWNLEWLVSGGRSVALAAGVLLVGKALAVGSGNSGGLTGPTVVIGAAGGALVAGLLGVAQPAVQAAACAAGIAAGLAAVLNVPIAATVIVTEIFGMNYGVPALVGAVLAYKLANPVFVYAEILTRPATARRGRRAEHKEP